MDAVLLETHRRLDEDLEFFAEHAPLLIQDKSGKLVPFKLNIGQRYLHERVEEQRRKHGWVRVIVVKGRQEGVSTYFEARGFHKVVRGQGLSAFILAHEAKATDHLFSMARRFYNNMNPALRPAREKDNPREMTFPSVNTGYSAATAGNEDAGRSCTSQIVHWSEVAYCDNDYAILDSMLQGIALIPGTEIVIESTANGPKGLYYDMCMAAMRGEGDYIFVFIPWFWYQEYEREDDGSQLIEEEEAFIRNRLSEPFPFQALPISRAQARRKILWRRAKVFELSPRNPQVGAAKFRAIYPSDPVEAFLSTAVGEIRADAIVAARSLDRTLELDPMAPRIGGCDPAGAGKKADRTIFAIRQGRVLDKVIRMAKLRPTELLGRALKIIEGERLDKLFVDNGYGEALVDHIRANGYDDLVLGVWFNQNPDNPDKYTNKRSEMLLSAADWVNDGGVSIPDGEEEELIAGQEWACGGHEIHADLACLPMHKETADGIHYVAPKEELVKLLGRSPDILDALALTFAFPVRSPAAQGNRWRAAGSSATIGSQNRNTGGGGLKSFARKRALGG